MLDLIFQGILACLSPINILAMLLAVPAGIIVGALPGFGAATGLVLALPMTYGMEPATAFVVLTGIYIGAEYGGSISAILINTPGTPAAIMTTLDGNPMARDGKARDALLISNIASFSGGLFGGLMMLFFMPILGNFVLHFGAGEVFVMAGVGLLLVGVITKGSRVKGVISVCLGLMYTFVGGDRVSGFSRFDFDIPILVGGLPLIAGLLAMFAIPQMLDLALGPKPDAGSIKLHSYGVKGNINLFKHWFSLIYKNQLVNIIRSGFFGLLGIIPGVGSAVPSMLSYTAAKKASKNPEEFGKGAVAGIVAPETSNNATVGSSLIPVLSLGIPSSPSAALFMGAIFLHGMTPGPNFMIKEANLVYILIMAVFLCSLMQLLLGVFTIGSFANILKVPGSLLFPCIIALCCIGAYAVRTQDFDIDFFIGFGIFAYFLSRLGFSMGAIVLGAFLAPTMEASLIEALNISPAMGGLFAYFMTRPIALGMVGLLILYGVIITILSLRQKKTVSPQKAAVADGPALWSGERGVDLGIYIIVGLCAWWFMRMAVDYPEQNRLLPNATFVVLMGISAFGALQCLFFPGIYRGKNTSALKKIPWKKLVIIAIALCAYLPLMYGIGFYPATVPFVVVCALLIRHWYGEPYTARDLIKIILFALIFTIAALIVFTIMFQTSMPIPEWLEDLMLDWF